MDGQAGPSAASVAPSTQAQAPAPAPSAIQGTAPRPAAPVTRSRASQPRRPLEGVQPSTCEIQGGSRRRRRWWWRQSEQQQVKSIVSRPSTTTTTAPHDGSKDERGRHTQNTPPLHPPIESWQGYGTGPGQGEGGTCDAVPGSPASSTAAWLRQQPALLADGKAMNE